MRPKTSVEIECVRAQLNNERTHAGLTIVLSTLPDVLDQSRASYDRFRWRAKMPFRLAGEKPSVIDIQSWPILEQWAVRGEEEG